MLEAFADKSYRRWRERDMAPDLDALQHPELPPQNVQLVGPAVGTGSGVEVPIPIMGAGSSAPPTPSKPRIAAEPSGMGKLDQPIPPSISVTRAAPQPLMLPTQSDIVPPTADRNFAPDDVEAGMSLGSASGSASREAVPLREMVREDSVDSVATATGPAPVSTSNVTTPIATQHPVNQPPNGILGPVVAEPEPSLMDAPPSPAVEHADPLGLSGPALVPVPPPSDDEAAELDEGATGSTIRLVGANPGTSEPEPVKVENEADGRGSLDKDEKDKKKRFSKGLSKLGLKGGKSKEEAAA